MTGGKRGWLGIQATFLLALALTLLPLDDTLSIINPQWLALVTAYWIIYAPERVGIFSAWWWGLLLDVGLGTHLGTHALALALVGYVTVLLHQRLRMYPLWQQSFYIWLIAALDKLTVLQLANIFMGEQVSARYWLSPMVSGLIWPGVTLSMVWLQHRYSHRT